MTTQLAGNGSTRLGHAEAAMSVLQQVAALLARIPHRRKALIYIGEGIDIDETDRVAVATPNDPTMALEAMHDFVATAARADTHVYTIDPRGLAGDDEIVEVPSNENPIDPGAYQKMAGRSVRVSIDRLREWAAETGGVSVVRTNDLAASLARIVEESSRYYALGYYSTSPGNDGRFHRIEVRVRRPGTTVRATSGYVADREPGASRSGSQRAAGGKPSPDAPSPLDQAIGLPTASDDVHLRVSTAAFLAGGGKNELIVVVGVAGRDLELTDEGGAVRGALELRVAALDERRVPSAARKGEVTMSIDSARRATLDAGEVGYVDRLELAPARYMLRVAAGAPSSSRVGALHAEVEVPDLAAAPLAVSGLLVGSALTPAAAGTAAVGRFTEWLPNGPTVRRQFSRNDLLTVFAEVYENAPQESIRVAARVFDQQRGLVLEEEAPLERTPAARQRHPYVAHVPLDSLTPGRYTFRLEVSSSGTSQPVVRVLAFEVVGP